MGTAASHSDTGIEDLVVAGYGLGRLNIISSNPSQTQHAVQVFSIHAAMFFTLFTGLEKDGQKWLFQLACDKLLNYVHR